MFNAEQANFPVGQSCTPVYAYLTKIGAATRSFTRFNARKSTKWSGAGWMMAEAFRGWNRGFHDDGV